MLSCSQSAESNEGALAKVPSIEQVALDEPVNKPADRRIPERKLIRNGSMSLEVEDVTTNRMKIDEFTQAAGGYVSSEKQNGGDEHPTYQQVIRIPGSTFDEFVSKVEGLALKIDAKQISVQDVTAEYVDIESRLLAKRKIEARFLEIVKQAKTIEGILRVEERSVTFKARSNRCKAGSSFLATRLPTAHWN